MKSSILFADLSFRFLRTLAQVLAIFGAVAFLIDFFEFARRSGGMANYSVLSGLWRTTLKMPETVEGVLPFAILFASTILLSTASRRSEIVVLRGFGLSAFQIMAPLCAISLGLGFLSMTALNPLAVRGIEKARLVEATVAGVEIVESPGNPRLWFEQRDEHGSIVIGAREKRKGGEQLIGATLLRFDELGALVERVDSRTAELIGQTWIFRDASQILTGDDRPRDIGDYRAQSQLSAEEINEKIKRPEESTIYELPRALELAKRAGISTASLATRFNWLLSTPLMFVAMCLIAAPMALSFHRSRGAVQLAFFTVAAGFSIYVLSSVVRSLGASAVIGAVAAGFLPALVALATGGAWLLFREEA